MAAALDVPGIAVRWDKKLDYFFDSLDLEKRVFSPETEADRLLAALETALVKGYKRELVQSHKENSKAVLLAGVD